MVWYIIKMAKTTRSCCGNLMLVLICRVSTALTPLSKDNGGANVSPHCAEFAHLWPQIRTQIVCEGCGEGESAYLRCALFAQGRNGTSTSNSVRKRPRRWFCCRPYLRASSGLTRIRVALSNPFRIVYFCNYAGVRCHHRARRLLVTLTTLPRACAFSITT